MTNEKAIEIMQDMKNHAERTDDKELMDACDTAIKALEQASDAEFMCKAMSKTVNKSTDDRNFIGGF